MDRNEKIIAQIKQQGFLPLFYHSDPQRCLDITRTLFDNGVRVIEFTNRGPNALENFKKLVTERDANMKGLVLAVGTVRQAAHASKFIDAGADLLISPVFDATVGDIAYLHKTLWIPGCMTPTEIHVAQNAGITLVKLFPGNVLGPSFVKGIKELFPGMDFMPTGGVELERQNLESWFAAGVCAVGIGSKFISQELMEARDYDKLAKDARVLIEIISKTRKSQ